MAYRLQPDVPGGKDIAGIIREQIERAIKAIRGGGGRAERVHVARTSCKRIRAALRLIRSANQGLWRRENACFRDAARELAPLREADVLPAAFLGLLRRIAGAAVDHRDLSAVHREIRAHGRRIVSDAGPVEKTLRRFEAQLDAARRHWSKIELEATEADLLEGFVDSYRWARDAWHGMHAGGSAADFHECRKRTKTHGYHFRLWRNLWPKHMRVWQRELGRLSERLGEEHDLAMLEPWLTEHADDSPADDIRKLPILIAAQRENLREQALVLSQRLFAARPRAFEQQISAWWKTQAAHAVIRAEE